MALPNPNDTYHRHGESGLLSTGVKTADVAVKADTGKVYWLTAYASAAAVIGLADSLTNSTTYVWKITLANTTSGHYIFDPPLEFATGIWLDVVSGTCDVVVAYA
jgi:hypothetical protein